MLVAAAIAVRAEGRDLVVVLEEGERDIPSSAGLFIHGEIMEGAKEKPREEAPLTGSVGFFSLSECPPLSIRSSTQERKKKSPGGHLRRTDPADFIGASCPAALHAASHVLPCELRAASHAVPCDVCAAPDAAPFQPFVPQHLTRLPGRLALRGPTPRPGALAERPLG